MSFPTDVRTWSCAAAELTPPLQLAAELIVGVEFPVMITRPPVVLENVPYLVGIALADAMQVIWKFGSVVGTQAPEATGTTPGSPGTVTWLRAEDTFCEIASIFEPPAPVQLSWYVAAPVCVAVTDSEPLSACAPFQAPDAEQVVALVELHVSVAVSPTLAIGLLIAIDTVGAAVGVGGRGSSPPPPQPERARQTEAAIGRGLNRSMMGSLLCGGAFARLSTVEQSPASPT